MFDNLPFYLLNFLVQICGQDKLLRFIFEKLEYHISMFLQQHSF